jgi:prepilin-type N-terminal cleavage/methylation domain-containing protein
MSTQKQQKGFTIIEVVLVLAIAGLIFLMVFIALPALQRNQRDAQRQTDLSRLQTAVTNYANSNRGSLPSNWGTFVNSYMTVGGDTFLDPSGATTAQGGSQTTYQLSSSTDSPLDAPFSESQNVIYYSVGYVCGPSSDTLASGGSRKVALRIALEGGGYHCLNN